MIIAPAVVQQIKLLWESGQDAAAISAAMGISTKEINALKKKGQWTRKSGLMLSHAKAKNKVAKADAASVLAEVMAGDKGAAKAHATAVFVMTSAALRGIKTMPKIKSVKDFEIMDRVARRSIGLDKDSSNGGATVINLGIVAGGFVPQRAEGGKPVDVVATPVEAA